MDLGFPAPAYAGSGPFASPRRTWTSRAPSREPRPGRPGARRRRGPPAFRRPAPGAAPRRAGDLRTAARPAADDHRTLRLGAVRGDSGGPGRRRHHGVRRPRGSGRGAPRRGRHPSTSERSSRETGRPRSTSSGPGTSGRPMRSRWPSRWPVWPPRSTRASSWRPATSGRWGICAIRCPGRLGRSCVRWMRAAERPAPRVPAWSSTSNGWSPRPRCGTP